MPGLNLAAILRMGWLIGALAVMPILRQFIVFKLLADADLAAYLFLSAVVITLTPLAALGWGDLFAGRLALDRQAPPAAEAPAYVVSCASIVAVASLAFGVLSLSVPLPLAAIAAADLLFVALLQNATKILRSQDRMRAFFGWLFAKQLVELALISAIAWRGGATAMSLLGVELLAASSTLLLLSMRLRIWRYLMPAKGPVAAHLKAALPTALAFLVNTAVVIVGQNLDRVGLPALVGADLYSSYMFVLINASVLISANAFVFHITYPRLAALQNDVPAMRRFVVAYDRVVWVAALVLVPVQAFAFVWVNDRLYHGLPVGTVHALLAAAIGWSYLVQIRETLLITAMRVRLVAVAAIGGIAVYVASIAALALSGNLDGLVPCLAAMLAGRVAYLLWLNLLAGAHLRSAGAPA